MSNTNKGQRKEGPKKKEVREEKTINELETLLVKLYLESTSSNVWRKFENSLKKLDPQSLILFEKYLDGHSFKDLSIQSKLTETEVARWIKQLKQELINNLRQECNVRQ